MFYQEKIINGVLCFRTSPNSNFEEYSKQTLTNRIRKMKSALIDIQNWDEELEERYDDPGQRASEGLEY